MMYVKLSLILLLSSLGAAYAQDGKAIFEKNCLACHTINGGKKVGPDLVNITKKRSLDWLARFITNSTEFIASGDKDANKVFLENGKMPMPSHSFTPAELNALISYLNNPGGAGGGSVSGGTDVVPAFVPTYDVGRNLFTGEVPLTNGGPSCISCHSVKEDKVFFGGTLAKDLSVSYAPGIVQTMATSMPAMINAYKTHELTLTEKSNLELFLKVVKENQLFSRSRQYPSLLFLGGFIIFCGLVVISFVFWRNPRKKGVRSDIFARQKKVLQKD